MQPVTSGGGETRSSPWLVVFCDEINLPAPDKYGTQRVVALLRQMVEKGGFFLPIRYHATAGATVGSGSKRPAASSVTGERVWVSLQRIQVGVRFNSC